MLCALTVRSRLKKYIRNLSISRFFFFFFGIRRTLFLRFYQNRIQLLNSSLVFTTYELDENRVERQTLKTKITHNNIIPSEFRRICSPEKYCSLRFRVKLLGVNIHVNQFVQDTPCRIIFTEPVSKRPVGFVEIILEFCFCFVFKPAMSTAAMLTGNFHPLFELSYNYQLRVYLEDEDNFFDVNWL